MRACLACVWERSEILSSHLLKAMVKKDWVSTNQEPGKKEMSDFTQKEVEVFR